MKKQLKKVTIFLSLLLAGINSFATWSIIIIDPVTKNIGIVGASCTNSVYGIGAIVPGKGAVVVQAMSNGLARLKGIEMIIAEASPEAILKAMQHPMYYPHMQQYGIVCLYAFNKPVAYSGDSTHDHKSTLTAPGISVQGNMLTNKDEVEKIMKVIKAAQKKGLSLEEVLMLALEAGGDAGGDKRCGDQKASSAFITVLRPTDNIKTENVYLNIVVSDIPRGGANAVKELRTRFDAWKKGT